MIQAYVDRTFNFQQSPGLTTLAKGILQSPVYKKGASGWMIDDQGAAEFNDVIVRGAISAATIDIGGADASSFHVDINGNLWSGAATFAAATFSVTNAGAVIASNITITGGSVVTSALNKSVQSFTSDLVFSITDIDTVAWASGTIRTGDGTSYSISAGNTGNMAALTYIYLNVAVSLTVLQTTTTYSTAVGDGKILIAAAQNGTTKASVIPYGGPAPIVTGDNISAGSILAANIAANTITAAQISTTLLYAGEITIDTAGLIKSGQTAYDTGTGWWIGNDAGTPKLSIGKGSGERGISWDGTSLSVRGGLNRDDYHWFTLFESVDAYGKTGTVTPGTATCNLLTGATSGNTASLLKVSGNVASSFSWDVQRRFRTVVKFIDNTVQDVFIGIGSNGTIGSTDRHVGFLLANGTLKGDYGNGTNNYLVTDMSVSVTAGDTLILEVRFYPGSSIQFFVNGILKGTPPTTNLPSGTSAANYVCQILVKTNENVAKSIDVDHWDFWQDSLT